MEDRRMELPGSVISSPDIRVVENISGLRPRRIFIGSVDGDQMLKKISSVLFDEGTGARANRLLGEGVHLDPFVLFDEYIIPPDGGFPLHGHGGFEAVQFLMEGGTEYRDNMDNRGIIGALGARKFVPGIGFQHSEYPSDGVATRGYLLWIKLSSAIGNPGTDYTQAGPGEIPLAVEDGFRKRTILGPGSPLRTFGNITFKHILSTETGSLNVYVRRGQNGFVYLSRGSLSLDRITLERGEGLVLEEGRVHTIEVSSGSEIVYAAGYRTNEAIIQDGGFVR
ncbi:MAG: pirin family protein [Thermoplasmatota archaeon]